MSERVHYKGPNTTKLCAFNKENIVLVVNSTEKEMTVSATKETNKKIK